MCDLNNPKHETYLDINFYLRLLQGVSTIRVNLKLEYLSGFKRKFNSVKSSEKPSYGRFINHKIHKSLKKSHFQPYKPKHVHILSEHDKARRKSACQRFMATLQEEGDEWAKRIIFSDEK